MQKSTVYATHLSSHLVLEVFARQLGLSRIVSPLTSILVKLSHSADTWNLIFVIQPLPLPNEAVYAELNDLSGSLDELDIV